MKRKKLEINDLPIGNYCIFDKDGNLLESFRIYVSIISSQKSIEPGENVPKIGKGQKIKYKTSFSRRVLDTDNSAFRNNDSGKVSEGGNDNFLAWKKIISTDMDAIDVAIVVITKNYEEVIVIRNRLLEKLRESGIKYND